ncbi:MAG TPA: type II toxin-antitoxin system VapC family toxin [Dyadobacter sp.]|jgi:PIN domain nuclease of toxin-antitoxin system|nr:type II toxin-antitoxin system VapC family toxin [Dyadobacter sp.]
MRYLLDTHTLIWAVMETDKLSTRVRDILENPDHVILVSAISFWEISLKFSIGKLDLQGILPHELPAAVRLMNFGTIALDTEDASTYYKLSSSYHRDPFDRMLIWQTINSNLTLISKDGRMSAYKSDGLKVIW